MELTPDQIVEKFAKQCMHCLRNTSLPHEDDWSCVVCGFYV